MTWETIKLAKLPLSFSKEAFNIEREQIKRGGFQISTSVYKDPTSRLIPTKSAKQFKKKDLHILYKSK